MDKLILIKPASDMMHGALSYKIEHLQKGEEVLHGSALMDQMEYDEWVQQVNDNASPETVHDNWVVASTFFAVRESDRKIVGMVDIRHTLNDFLASYGGHIGYGVRPSERRKGYGTQILMLALEYAKTLNLERVMVACDKENTGSRKIIQKCGGEKEKEFIHSDGTCVEVYWIKLK